MNEQATESGHFTIRVYALIINEKDEILLCDEHWFGRPMTKFPGGALEYGEGTRDCLRRELMEEMQVEAEIGDHFYTTDFYKKALFFESTQLISIYYYASLAESATIRLVDKPFEGIEQDGDMVFRRVKIADLDPNTLSFEIDQKVAAMLKEAYSGRTTQPV